MEVQGGSESAKPTSMRGRKKHKCSVCGNSAKSRCPFYSCKGCCVKAKNPCHIHVLKSSSASETAQALSSAVSTPHPSAATLDVRHHHPNDSLRLRTFKPLGIITKKEAFVINHLRFKKLRTFTEGIVEAEDEAFDRYTQNMALLKAIFAGDNIQDRKESSPEDHLLSEGGIGSENFTPIDGGVDATSLSEGLQVMLCSIKKKDTHRQKLSRAIERSFQRLNKGDQGGGILENEDLYPAFSEVRRDMKRMKVQSAEGKERVRKMDVFASMAEKIKQVESQEDFESCFKMFEDTYGCRDTVLMSNGISTVVHVQELGSERKHMARGWGQEDSEREVGKLGAFCEDGRVDSCGVLKSWWKVVDWTEGKADPYAHIPTPMLQAL